VVGYPLSKELRREEFTNLMADLSERLPKDGLIYVSNHEHICNKIYKNMLSLCTTATERNTKCITDLKEILPKCVIVDSKLTAIARRYENGGLWAPAVYRKV